MRTRDNNSSSLTRFLAFFIAHAATRIPGTVLGVDAFSKTAGYLDTHRDAERFLQLLDLNSNNIQW
jgi:hypothetical protein